MDIVVTGRAKASIRRRLREDDRERFVKLGRELARVAFRHVGREATDRALTIAAKQLRLEGTDEILARLGSAELTGAEVVAAVYPELHSVGDEIDVDAAVRQGGDGPHDRLSGPGRAGKQRQPLG